MNIAAPRLDQGFWFRLLCLDEALSTLLMRLTILGSGTNVHPTRAAAGYLVRTDQYILLDFGPRTLMNLIKTGVDRHRITHILFSHFHADHFSDFITFFFDAVIHNKYGGGHRPGMTLIGPKGTVRLLQSIMRNFPSFSPAPFSVTWPSYIEPLPSPLNLVQRMRRLRSAFILCSSKHMQPR